MSNITDNRINAVIPALQVTAATNGITAADAAVAPTIGNTSLTEPERESMFSLNVDNKVQVEETQEEVTNNPGPLPAYIVSGNLNNDLALFNQLDILISQVKILLQKLEDGRRLAGHEAFGMALCIYQLYKAAALAGVPGAQASYDRLKQRFEGQGGGAPPTP